MKKGRVNGNALRQLLNLGRFRLQRRDLFRLSGYTVLAGASGVRAQNTEGGTTSSPEIWTSYFREKTVWAYVDKHSVAPGEHFDLMLSTRFAGRDVAGRVEFFRIEPLLIDSGQRMVWRSPVVGVRRQPVLRSAAAVGLDWSPTIADIDTSEWPPGCYSADFVADDTQARDRQIAQFVVTNPRRSGELLLKLCTNTYQAYNAWGGHSLYPNDDEGRGVIVSFDRPNGPAFFEYDVYLARWLEEVGRRRGFSVDYATDFDVHRDFGFTDQYRLMISGAHDEYWSKEEFDGFDRRIHRLGRNTIVSGANTAYFQVRYADVNRPPGDIDHGRQIICFKSVDDPISRRKGTVDPQLLVTARFRDNARRPEIMLTGVAYQDWFAADAPGVPYYVETTDAPFFEGTGIPAGRSGCRCRWLRMGQS